MKQAKPSYIFRSGSRLRRSGSSAACSSCKSSGTRPNSLCSCKTSNTEQKFSVFKKYSTIQNRGKLENNYSNEKKELDTIEENSQKGEPDYYIIQIGCNNWVGRSEHKLNI